MRCFIAIELPEKVTDALRVTSATIKPSLDDPAVRWVPLENIHLTIKFLGEITSEQKSAIQQALARSCGEMKSFPINLSGFGCFPNPGKPRIFWIGIQNPTGGLNELQQIVESECAALGFERERRQFKPHLTLARVKGSTDLEEPIMTLMGAMEGDGIAGFTVDRVTLFRSDLYPTGAQYTQLSHHLFQGDRDDG